MAPGELASPVMWLSTAVMMKSRHPRVPVISRDRGGDQDAAGRAGTLP